MALVSKASKTRHPAYQAWLSLRYRCNNSRGKNSCYQNISYDSRWELFENFWEDMGPSWERGLTIDRIDSTKDYSKENCRWADKYEQANNRSNNRKITLNGVTRHLHEWSELSGIKRTTITQRIDSYGWSVEKALTTSAGRVSL